MDSVLAIKKKASLICRFPMYLTMERRCLGATKTNIKIVMRHPT